MRIKDVVVKIVNVSIYTNWIIVILHTDEGVCGYGDATLDTMEFKVKQAIEAIAERIIGKNVLDCSVELADNADGMVGAAAVSGLNIALWDLKAKAVGLPIYQLLGGLQHRRVPTYVSFNRSLKGRTPDDFSKMVETLMAGGDRAFKCAPFDEYFWREPIGSETLLSRGFERVKAIRETIGNEAELSVDCHWRFEYSTALKVAEALQAYRLFWIEAPLPETDAAQLSRLRHAIHQRIAGCEMQTSLSQYLPMLEQKALDVYMSDVKYIGGISGLKRAASLVETFDCQFSPHNMTSPISTAATLHVMASEHNILTMEHHCEESGVVSELFDTSFTHADGCFIVSDEPGLGITFDEKKADSFPYRKPQPLRKNMLGG